MTEERPPEPRPARGRRIFNAGGSAIQWVALALLALGFLSTLIPLQ